MSNKNVPKVIKKKTVDQQAVSSPEREAALSCGAALSSRQLDGCILLSTDEKGTVRRVNPFGITFFGKRETDILGYQFDQIVLPDNFEFDRRKKRFLYHFLYTPELNHCVEFDTRHVSGRPRRVAWTRSVVRDSEGAIAEILYVGIDVRTEAADIPEIHRPDETGMCNSDSNFTLLEKHIQNSKVWAWEMNADAVFCYVSPGVEKLLGYSQEELIGVGMDSLMTPNGNGRLRRTIDEAIGAGSRKFKFENQFRCKNGELLWSETAGVFFFDKNNLFSGARGLNRDISREVAARDELIQKEKEYRYLFNNTQVALLMLNEDGVILNINQTGAKMHGREAGEMIGRKIVEFIRKSERRAAKEAFFKTYRSAKAQKENFIDIEPHTVRMDTPRGTRYLRLVPKAIKVMENGEMVGILNTVQDITESHVLQKELERHKLKLQQLVDERTEEIQTIQEEMLRGEQLTTLGRLTSTVSHEIRNPLGTINSSFYIINERLKGKDFGVGRAVERGSRAIRRCDRIIEEMLDFTRTKGLEKRTIDISSWLEKLLDEVRIPENVSIIRLIDDGLSGPIDAGRLRRCVLNILENSLAALHDDSEGIIRVSARISGRRLEISVRDNGPGISKKMQKRVFDPLYSTKQNGIGMGLPVCKQVMELHGGSISLRSEKGKGTTATLRLQLPLME